MRPTAMEHNPSQPPTPTTAARRRSIAGPPRSRSGADPPSAGSSTNTSRLDRGPGQRLGPNSGTPQASRGPPPDWNKSRTDVQGARVPGRDSGGRHPSPGLVKPDGGDEPGRPAAVFKTGERPGLVRGFVSTPGLSIERESRVTSPLCPSWIPRPAGTAVAVGTALAGGPPRRSQRAGLPHWAPALGEWRRSAPAGRDASCGRAAATVSGSGPSAPGSDSGPSGYGAAAPLSQCRVTW